MPKNRKPLTPREQLKNLCDGLVEDALNDTTPLTKQELAEAERVKNRLLKRVESEVSWEQKAAKRKANVKPKYIN